MTDLSEIFEIPNTFYSDNLRLQAVDGGPLRGGESYQFGFYDAGVLREILEEFGGSYEVRTLPIPKDKKEYDIAVSKLQDPNLQYALVDKNKIVYVYIENCPGWMSAINQLGYVVNSGAKANKRTKSFHRPTLINAHFEHLNVLYVEDGEFSRYDFSEYGDVAARFRTPEVMERLGDGGFIISKRIIQEGVKNLPVYNSDSKEETKDYYYDPRVRKSLVNHLLNAPMWNIRILFEDGILKGNCAAVDLPDGIDIITTRSNVKDEIKYNRGFRVLAEPQSAKSKVVTDDQTVINLPKLFRKSDMEMWLTEEYKKMYSKAINGELLTNWEAIYKRIWKDNDNIEDNEARARMAYVGYRWTAAGFKVTQSPWLFETVSISHSSPLEKRIMIPCAVYEQIVPESFVRMAGFNIEVEEYTIRRCNELGVHVVNDLDWLEMYESHGGCDQDDFFKLFYRTMKSGEYDGEKVVITVRSPNGYGEYSIFRYVEGEWNPAWHKADGTEIRFPEVNGRNWPKRLSEAVFDKTVTYTGLPSRSKPKQKRSGPYTTQDVIRDIDIAMAGGNVGGFVNATMLHSMVIGKHRHRQLCSLETAVDKCINPDDADDVIAIDAEATKMVREVIASGKPVDSFFWEDRKLKYYLGYGEFIPFMSGKIDQIANLCSKHRAKYINDIKTWSQENARPPQIVYDLGNRFKHRALTHLKQFRMTLYNTNASDQISAIGGIDRSIWEILYQDTVDTICSFERTEDRHDYVLGLYVAALEYPTSNKKITDQIVINRFVYPYLEAALQFYGVAYITMYEYDKSNKMTISSYKNDSWFWPDSDGSIVHYDNCLEFQAAHMKDSPVLWKMPYTELEDEELKNLFS